LFRRGDSALPFFYAELGILGEYSIPALGLKPFIRRITLKKLLIVIDMQNGFIDGTLGTLEAVAIVS